MVTPARKIAPLPEMGRLIWRRQYRGLLYHRGVHPSDYPRQLISRATGWDEAPVNGLCRWCGTPTANFRLTWHTYCFNAYRVATGLKPVQIQKTLCVRCGGPPVDLDHELSIVVARALGEAALLRAFTLPNLRWLCKGCHRRKTRLDRRLEHYARSCDLNWRAALGLVERHRAWFRAFLTI